MKNLLDWSSYQDAGMGDAYADIPRSGGNFAKAVAVCINSHQCEKIEKGVMCPSYRVTELPQYSTGGRVRLLKAALNGGLGEHPFSDNKLEQAMDLCLACKGCKRECENEVDMAMLKVEYLAQRYLTHKVPLRTRLLANLAQHLHRYRFLKTLTRWRNRLSWLRLLGDSLLGLSKQRQLPEPVQTAFLQNYHAVASEVTQVNEVVLLLDTFSNNFAPQQAQDAITVLQRAGYKVIVAQPDTTTSESERPLCCGRTYIAHGLVEQAKSEAQRMLSVLQPHVAAGRTIIGLEPACLLAIRDDYKFLGLGPAAQHVAEQALLFEEFIAREISAKRFGLQFKPLATNQPLLVHGHCHQKAVGAMKSVRKVLKLIPQLQFELIESTCCGMAGSFGVETEHSEIAMQMAEQSLLPALRAQPDATIVANGFSCRHQINEGVQRNAMHIATLLKEALP